MYARVSTWIVCRPATPRCGSPRGARCPTANDSQQPLLFLDRMASGPRHVRKPRVSQAFANIRRQIMMHRPAEREFAARTIDTPMANTCGPLKTLSVRNELSYFDVWTRTRERSTLQGIQNSKKNPTSSTGCFFSFFFFEIRSGL